MPTSGPPFEDHASVANPTLAAVTVCELNPDHDPDGSAVPRFVHGLVEALAA